VEARRKESASDALHGLLASLLTWAHALPIADATPMQTPCPPGGSLAPARGAPPAQTAQSTETLIALTDAEAAPAAEAVVACVGPGPITKLAFEHWRSVAAADSSGSHRPSGHVQPIQ
jgi:hypothetical protein